jgi:hypothetical protein
LVIKSGSSFHQAGAGKFMRLVAVSRRSRIKLLYFMITDTDTPSYKIRKKGLGKWIMKLSGWPGFPGITFV